MKIKKAVIIGMGLIGGSIGKALIEKGLADEVSGVFRRESSLERARTEGAFSEGKGFVNEYQDAVSGADVIFICTPVYTIEKTLEELAGVINDKKVLVTDVGSTKKEIVVYAAKFKDKFTFIGGHPLAGSEKAGVEYSEADLFENSVCVLTPDDQTPREGKEKLQELWEAIGAKVCIFSPDKHDENLALSSHLPHAVAYALTGTLDEKFPQDMLATGFKDTTRIASSDATLWSDIFMSNSGNVLQAIKAFKDVLGKIEKDITEGNIKALKEKLEKIKKIRDGISKE